MSARTMSGTIRSNREQTRSTGEILEEFQEPPVDGVPPLTELDTGDGPRPRIAAADGSTSGDPAPDQQTQTGTSDR